jgi:hypothetical protein
VHLLEIHEIKQRLPMGYLVPPSSCQFVRLIMIDNAKIGPVYVATITAIKTLLPVISMVIKMD